MLLEKGVTRIRWEAFDANNDDVTVWERMGTLSHGKLHRVACTQRQTNRMSTVQRQTSHSCVQQEMARSSKV